MVGGVPEASDYISFIVLRRDLEASHRRRELREGELDRSDAHSGGMQDVVARVRKEALIEKRRPRGILQGGARQRDRSNRREPRDVAR
jgi:hypothetical protein